MKKSISIGVAIVSVITCILVMVCLWEIADLKQQIFHAEHNLYSAIDMASVNTANNLYATIESLQADRDRIMISRDCTYGDIDAEKKTATVHWTFVPKEYRPDETRAVLVFNGKEYPMTLKNGEYTVSLPIPLFEDTVFSQVQLIDGDTIRTEILGWNLSPRFELLPEIFAYFSGGSGFDARDGKFRVEQDGEITISVRHQTFDAPPIQAISMVEYINGEEISRTDIPLTDTSSAISDTVQPTIPPMVGGSYENPSYFYYQMNKISEIPFGSTYELCVEVVDGYGLLHREWLDYFVVDSDGTPSYEPYSPTSGSNIYDESGNVLWSAVEAIYR